MLALPNQIPGLINRFGLLRAQCDWELWAVAPDGRRWSGAAAVNHTLTQLGGVWALFGALYRFPPVRWIQDWVYRWVADHRPLMSSLWGSPPEWDE